MKDKIAALVASLVLAIAGTLGVIAVAPPVQAESGCVNLTEYNATSDGDRMVTVHNRFGTDGAELSLYRAGDYWYQTRQYPRCSDGWVNVQYRRPVDGGYWRVVWKGFVGRVAVTADTPGCVDDGEYNRADPNDRQGPVENDFDTSGWLVSTDFRDSYRYRIKQYVRCASPETSNRVNVEWRTSVEGGQLQGYTRLVRKWRSTD